MKPAAAALALTLAAPTFAGLSPLAAAAGSSAWEQAQGGAVRVVVASRPQPDGSTRAALEIELKPGWKTYWVDPGSSGVPPTVALTADGAPVAVAMDLPAPRRFDDGYSSFAGYGASVALALSFRPPAGAKSAVLDFSVFLGICETICIPVQATLSVDTAAGSAGDDAAVDAAFAALPAAARPGFGIASAWVEGDELIVATAVPDGAAAVELFVASTPSFVFGEPKASADGRGFRVPLLDRPAEAIVATEAARYTLIADGEAVAGTIPVSGHP
jgi:DsbC/DsbD-like thiol-disulfide interchange protein